MVTVVEGGEAVVYARADAGPRDFADEAVHLVQLNDPRSPMLAEHIRTPSEATLGQWQEYDVELRMQRQPRRNATVTPSPPSLCSPGRSFSMALWVCR